MTTPTFDRPLTEDDNALLTHISMWGSDGYPVRKLGRKWFWSFRSIEAPRLYATKREAIAAFETYLNVLHDCKAAEAQRRAIAARNAQIDAQERDTLQSTASAKAERDAKLAELLDEEAVQRCEVQSIERTISELQDARRALTTDATTARALMRQISRMLDVERVEVAELNRVRAAIAMLLPRGTSLSTL